MKIDIDIKRFDTPELIEELYLRVYDSIHDEEERFDPILNNMGEEHKEVLVDVLRPLYQKIYEDRRAKKIETIPQETEQ